MGQACVCFMRSDLAADVDDMLATRGNVESLALTHYFWPTQFQDAGAQLCR